MLEPLSDVGITGAIDIALMAVLVYLGLVWLERRRAGNVLRGLLLLGVAYLGARSVGLQLVVAVMEGFFVVAFLAAVLLYRDEVRRVVERVAHLGRRDRKAASGADEAELRVLVDTLFELAEDRIGALVAIEGSEVIEPHLDGGTELNGALSAPLLKSIFDPGSDGHDGAVVIRERRLTRFGAHLPLSTNFDALGALGTRHAAALGLAEVSDALCLAVSEERGQVSLAYRGELRPLTQPAELEAELRTFLEREGKPAKRRRRVNGTLAMTAILVACAAWMVLVYGSRPTQRTYLVPVKVVDIAQDLKVGVVRPEQVRVTLGGPLRDFYFVSEDDIKVVVSAARMSAGPRAVKLSPADVSIPPSLVFRGVRPDSLTLQLDAEEKKGDQ